MQAAIDKALSTWYSPDSPKYRDPEYPVLKLAGEIGELLDLYAKHKFKPGFDWTDCKHCESSAEWHSENNDWCRPWKAGLAGGAPPNEIYTSLVLDELGDVWYYLRILAWIKGAKISSNFDTGHWPIIGCIIEMYDQASRILINPNLIPQSRFDIIYGCLIKILSLLDTDIDHLTELNYQKLNSESTNHGWKDAK